MNIKATMTELTDHEVAGIAGESTQATVHTSSTDAIVYLRKVLTAFCEALPEDDADIYMHVKNRNDLTWGVVLDSLVPTNATGYAVSLGLGTWEYNEIGREQMTVDNKLRSLLGALTYEFVTGLCHMAFKVFETAPADAYLAYVNQPGCLPDDSPIGFDSTGDAWEHLADEREFLLAEHEIDRVDDNAWQVMNGMVDGSKPALMSLHASNPGVMSEHDLGLVYTVVENEDYR